MNLHNSTSHPAHSHLYDLVAVLNQWETVE
jgi:hypothetical protein